MALTRRQKLWFLLILFFFIIGAIIAAVAHKNSSLRPEDEAYLQCSRATCDDKRVAEIARAAGITLDQARKQCMEKCVLSKGFTYDSAKDPNTGKSK